MNELDLFAAALAITNPAVRAALLDRECADQPGLRERLSQLLDAHARSNPLLDRPAADVSETTRTYHHPAEAAGTIIAGKYKLLQQIGEGGMGTVWMADQTEPVKRRVAVKLIRVERSSSSTILARFEAERQAIALMDHPNIAKLLDAGATESGAPFFVMELVKGIPLNDYCDTHKLSIPERLKLFTQICSAVQHAHQKGIIHRDLKPTNILVESHDGKPVPKVIDFGLAKATSGLQLTENTLFTGFGTVMGTPTYMAPEQANFNAVDVDTRADVYALGVILYELLTGTTPLTRESIKKAALDEMLKLIREQEAPTPSSRLSSSDSKPTVAANRQSEPQKLGRFVKGELDWIVLKALSKERDRRYETANGFAKDIERFLNHEPVLAGPVTSAYRIRKFVERNKGRVLAAGLLLFALVGGVAGTTLGFVRASAQRDRAVASEEEARAASQQAARAQQEASAQKNRAVAALARADDEATIAKAVNDFLLKDLLAPASQGPFALGAKAEPNPDVTIRELMKRAESRLRERFGDQPLIEASVRELIAQSYMVQEERQDDSAAIANLERVAELMALHHGPLHHKTLEARWRLANWTVAAGRQSEPLKRRGFLLLDGIRDTLTTLPDPLSGEMANTVLNVAHEYVGSGRPKDAMPLFERYLVADPSDDSRKDCTTVFRVRLSLADAHRALGDTNEANRVTERVRSDFAETLAGTVEPSQYRMLLIFADQLKKLGKPVSVEGLYNSARANAERLDAANDREALAAWSDLGDALSRDGRSDEAIRAYERGRVRLEQQIKNGGSILPVWFHQQGVYQSLGNLYLAKGKKEEAFASFKKYLETCRERGLSSDFGTSQLWVVAVGFRQSGRHAEAIPILREAMELNRKASGPESGFVASLELQIGVTWLEAGRPKESVEVLTGLIARLKPEGKSRDTSRIAYLQRAKGLEALSQFDRAADDLDAAYSLSAENSRDRWDMMSFRATNRARAGRAEEALRDADVLAASDEKYSNGSYNAACIYSLVSAKTSEPAKSGSASKAVQCLRKAVTGGKMTLSNILGDKDFDPIRERKEYLVLIAELQAKQLAESRKRPVSPKRPIGDEIVQYSFTLIKIESFPEAEPLLRECIAIREKTLPDDWRTFNTYSLLGAALLGQKKYAEAEPILLKGYEGMKSREKTIPPLGSIRIPEAVDRLVDLYTATNKPDEVKKWQEVKAKLPKPAEKKP